MSWACLSVRVIRIWGTLINIGDALIWSFPILLILSFNWHQHYVAKLLPTSFKQLHFGMDFSKLVKRKFGDVWINVDKSQVSEIWFLFIIYHLSLYTKIKILFKIWDKIWISIQIWISIYGWRQWVKSGDWWMVHNMPLFNSVAWTYKPWPSASATMIDSLRPRQVKNSLLYHFLFSEPWSNSVAPIAASFSLMEKWFSFSSFFFFFSWVSTHTDSIIIS